MVVGVVLAVDDGAAGVAILSLVAWEYMLVVAEAFVAGRAGYW